jgi:hypothetical protein
MPCPYTDILLDNKSHFYLKWVLLAVSLSACDRNECSKAQKANTIKAYKAFLEKYPNGKFVGL